MLATKADPKKTVLVINILSVDKDETINNRDIYKSKKELE